MLGVGGRRLLNLVLFARPRAAQCPAAGCRPPQRACQAPERGRRVLTAAEALEAAPPPSIAEAVQGLGFPARTDIQELAYAPLLAGRNAVLAAETGSGKTYAYLVPLLTRLLQERGHERGEEPPPAVLVLCPNASLCNQVVAVAQALRGPGGEPLVGAVYYSTRFVPPRGPLPEVLVATPAGLITATQSSGPFFGRAWSREGILDRARAVVLDEADLLLTGGFARDARTVLEALRLADRGRKAGQVCSQLGLDDTDFQALPRHLRKIALEGGADALKAAGFQPPKAFLWDPPAPQQGGPQEPAEEEASGQGPQPEASTSGRDGNGSSSSGPAAAEHWERQYVFAAATLPEGAGKTVAADIRKLVPGALWLSTQGLHRGRAEAMHHWRAVRPDTQEAALQETVVTECGLGAGRGRVLVFCNDVGAARGAAQALRGVGLAPLEFHREVAPEACAAALAALQAGEGVVLVCTDAAARGIDIPGVTAVVQADFPTSAVTFLHRVGRTARAGAKGVVFSLVPPERQVLADAIREALEAGERVEGAFSRKRSFAKKVKRYGKYVPRGERGDQT